MNIESATRRYLQDPQFHILVDTMMNLAAQLKFSPGELREAAVFAEIRFQQRAVMMEHSLVLEDLVRPPDAPATVSDNQAY